MVRLAAALLAVAPLTLGAHLRRTQMSAGLTRLQLTCLAPTAGCNAKHDKEPVCAEGVACEDGTCSGDYSVPRTDKGCHGSYKWGAAEGYCEEACGKKTGGSQCCVKKQHVEVAPSKICVRQVKFKNEDETKKGVPSEDPDDAWGACPEGATTVPDEHDCGHVGSKKEGLEYCSETTKKVFGHSVEKADAEGLPKMICCEFL